MKNLKEKLDTINNELEGLNKERLNCLKEIEKAFNEKASDYLRDGYKIFKMNLNNKIVYGILERIEKQVWSNGKSCTLNTINAYGLFIYVAKNFKSFYGVNDMMCVRPERVFSYFDDIEEISLDEFNKILSTWIKETEQEYYLEFAEDDDWNWEDWFYDDHYNRYFDKNNYRTFLNNEDLNNLYKRIE
jgi:hypothetical protein